MGLVFITHFLVHEEEIIRCCKRVGMSFSEYLTANLKRLHIERLGLLIITCERIERRKVIEPRGVKRVLLSENPPVYFKGFTASIAGLLRFGLLPDMVLPDC